MFYYAIVFEIQIHQIYATMFISVIAIGNPALGQYWLKKITYSFSNF